MRSVMAEKNFDPRSLAKGSFEVGRTNGKDDLLEGAILPSQPPALEFCDSQLHRF